jgi:hypothetical protein
MARKFKWPGYRRRDKWMHQPPLVPDFKYRKVKPMAKVNKYYCGSCNQDFVTIEDPATLPQDWVAPFMIECLTVTKAGADGKPIAVCGGMAQSAMYRGCDGLTPAYEWRKATPEEIRNSGPNRAQYLRDGGVSLFLIATAKVTKEIIIGS